VPGGQPWQGDLAVEQGNAVLAPVDVGELDGLDGQVVPVAVGRQLGVVGKHQLQCPVADFAAEEGGRVMQAAVGYIDNVAAGGVRVHRIAVGQQVGGGGVVFEQVGSHA